MGNKILSYIKLKDNDITFFVYVYIVLIINYIFDIIYNQEILQSIFLGEIFTAYLLTLFKRKLSSHKLLYRVYMFLISLWVIVFFFIDFYCCIILNHAFDVDTINLILGSNLQESYEFSRLFFINFFSVKGLCICTSLLLFNLVFLFVRKKNIKIHKIIHILIMITTIMSLSFYLTLEVLYKEKCEKGAMIPPPTLNLFAKTFAFFRLEAVPDLNLYYSNPQLTCTKNKLPKNLVIIIGESFSKSHSSLYGYSKLTNPRLQSLKEQNYLFVFNNVQSPGIQTVPSFKYFMSDYSHENHKSIKWYQCLTIPEVFKTLGYSVQWVSNQARNGFHNNVCAKYGEICDSCFFMGEVNFNKHSKNTCDERILPQLNKMIDYNKSVHQMYFIHLMGSHYSYKDRYPITYSQFSPKDYPNVPEHQKENFATYDTSIAYNDSIVKEIINIFSKKESLIVYFPDHGQDFYQSDPYYFGHAKYTPKSEHFGKEIPFMIYLSPQLKDNRPSLPVLLEKNLNNKFNTEHLLYSLMDLVEAKFVTNNKVAEYSLFQIR